MAIQFLNALNVQGNVDLNANQLVQVRIENLGTNPAATAGRMYYNSGDGSMRYYDGVNTSWVSLDGTGDVDSIAVANGGSSSGTALSVNSSTGAGFPNICGIMIAFVCFVNFFFAADKDML